MQSAEKALISFFNQVTLKNTAMMVKLKSEKCFDLDGKKWDFFLPDLHSFLLLKESAFKNIDYNTFRKILFNSQIHQTIKSNGGEIIISKNHRNVDKSRYTLIWK